MEWLVKLLHINECGAEAVTAVATCLLAILTIATLIAVIWVGVTQLRQIRKDSHKSLIFTITNQWESRDMLESRWVCNELIKPDSSESPDKLALQFKDKLEQLREKGDIKYYHVIRISNHMETVGYLMRSRKDKQIIKDLWGDSIGYYYDYFESWISEMRKQYPRIYVYFSELARYCKD